MLILLVQGPVSGLTHVNNAATGSFPWTLSAYRIHEMVCVFVAYVRKRRASCLFSKYTFIFKKLAHPVHAFRHTQACTHAHSHAALVRMFAYD